MNKDAWVIYHPIGGFLVDDCAGGAWSENRGDARAYASHGAAYDGISVAVDNGMAHEQAVECVILRWR